MSNRKLLSLIALIILVLSAGYFVFRNYHPSESSGKLKVATSFYSLYFFTKEIGGDKVDVTNITPAGAEPHDHDPSTGDIVKIEESKMLVLNGAVESWGHKIKDILKGSNVLVVTAGEGLLTKQLTEGGQTGVDPHVWLDPILAKQEAHAIAQGLIKVDPADTTFYQHNEKKLDGELDQLDQDYRKGLVSCQQKDIITSHAAFAYLGSRYGLNQVAISGLSPDAEPSAAQLADATNFAKSHNVRYIFFESLVSPKLSDTIANEVGAKTLVLDPIEGLTDNDIKAGKTYFTVMQDNLNNLRIALSCK